MRTERRKINANYTMAPEIMTMLDKLSMQTCISRSRIINLLVSDTSAQKLFKLASKRFESSTTFYKEPVVSYKRKSKTNK